MISLWAILVILCVFLKSASPEEKKWNCESRWKKTSEAGYRRFCNANFDEAEKKCQALGAHLVSIHSEEENQFVRAKKDKSGKWYWVDGTEMNFTRWSVGEPNNSGGNEGCAEMFIYSISSVRDTYWNDIPCSRTMRFFVCKLLRVLIPKL
ncbi:hypothetical protein Aduo_013539 [Ancylostoma duodenale]